MRFEDGQPVPGGVIEFRPEAGGTSARAKLDSAGRFELGTFEADDGAAEGSYRVIVLQHFQVPPRAAGGRQSAEHQAHGSHPDARVDDRYANYARSPLIAAVRRDSENYFEFVVARRHAWKRQARLGKK